MIHACYLKYFVRASQWSSNGGPLQNVTSANLHAFCIRSLRSFNTGASLSLAPAATAERGVQVKDFSEMPGPKPLPIVGNTLFLIRHKEFDPQDFSKFWKQLVVEYGPIVKLKVMGMPPMVISTNPDDVETFLRATMDNPVCAGFNSVRKLRLEERNNFYNKKTGLLTENGEEWWRVRSRVQGPLLRPRNVAMYLPAVDDATKKFMNRIELLQVKTGRVPDNFVHELFKWALESIALVALNSELGCLEPDLPKGSRPLRMIQYAQEIEEAMTVLELGGSYLWKYYRTAAYVKMETAHDGFLEIALEAIKEAEVRVEEAKAQGDPDRKLTIMETFLNTEGLTRSDVATMIMDLLMGGIETTSLTVGYALYLLARNPETQRDLQQKVDAVVKKDDPLTPEHITQLSCIVHAVKETLRLYPVAFANARVLTHDAAMSGYRVPAGNFVLGLNGLISRMEEYFQRPLEFLPEGWQRGRPHGEIHPFASLPFSRCTRMCIGKRLAEQEIYTFLIRVLQRYTVTYELEQEMVVKTQLVPKPMTPLAFKFHPRYST